MSTHLSSWLAGEDVTTPANDRHPVAEPGRPEPRRVEYRSAAPVTAAPVTVAPVPVRRGRADALALLAAVWVVVAAVPLAYLPTGRFDMFWNDTTVGVAAAAVTMVRLARTGLAPSTTGITLVLGGWLVAAPFVLGYGHQPYERPAQWNDLVSGAAIAVLSLATMVTTRTRRSVDPVPPRSAGLVVGAVHGVDAD
jgi:hypothetical protein